VILRRRPRRGITRIGWIRRAVAGQPGSA